MDRECVVVSLRGSITFLGCTIPKKRTQYFVFFCMKHNDKLTADRNKDDAFITRGFKNWKNSPKAFDIHQQSKAHRAALTFESVVPKCGDVVEMTVEKIKDNRIGERKYLIKIMEVIRFLARQGLAFRGGKENNDNVTQLFKLLNKNVPDVLTRLDKDFKLESGQHVYFAS